MLVMDRPNNSSPHLVAAPDPIILTSDQRTPADGPLLPDGTISIALYGSLESRGDARGFRVNFQQGDSLQLSLLIPDLAPEDMLEDSSLPYLNLADPSGAITCNRGRERHLLCHNYR